MDLFKYAYQLYPFISSELLRECLLLAISARKIDMRASPYDVSSVKECAGNGISNLHINLSIEFFSFLFFSILFFFFFRYFACLFVHLFNFPTICLLLHMFINLYIYLLFIYSYICLFVYFIN